MFPLLVVVEEEVPGMLNVKPGMVVEVPVAGVVPVVLAAGVTVTADPDYNMKRDLTEPPRNREK